MATPTPKDLDPKYKKTVPTKGESSKDTHPEDDESMIVHRVNFTDDNGVQQQKEHRVPIKDWPAYAEKHGF